MIGRRRETPDVAARVAALEAALEIGGSRLEPDHVTHARAVIERTGERLRLGANFTVVALAGATGSGKSSLFNALTGLELAEAGARRPTTGKPMACVWGPDDADPLLDWLEVPPRHRTARETVLDVDRQDALAGLVLLDLPDHDSTVMAHRLEVDRLVGLVDLLVWVVDPQKYADEALHSRYLRGLSGHDGVMLVVLNQVDRLTGPDQVATCTKDLRRLLDSDGLTGVQVLATSARLGTGVGELREVLADVVGRRAALIDRITADLDDAAALLGKGVADTEADPEQLPGSDELVGALSAAAGIPVVLAAVQSDYLRQASGRIGWPFSRWARALRPDPLSRLRLGGAEAEVRALTRSSLPAPTPAQRARVELAVRAVTAHATETLPALWAGAVRSSAASPQADLTDALDMAVGSVDLELARPTWWRVLDGVQVALAVSAVVGFVWLAVVGVAGWLRVPDLGTPRVGPVALPTLMLLGGLLLGLVLTGVGRWVVQVGAQRRRASIEGELRIAVATVAWEHVVAPVSAVLQDHRAVREALISG